MRKYSLLLLVFLYLSAPLFAQEWTAQDSLWLRRVLSGEEKLQLNDAARKAIRNGTLLFADSAHVRQPQQAPAERPIFQIDASIQPPGMSARSAIALLPPSVHILSDLDAFDPMPIVPQSAILPYTNIAVDWTEKMIPNGFVSRSIGFSAEDLLRTLFWASHRAKMRNRKIATSWKTYNQF